MESAQARATALVLAMVSALAQAPELVLVQNSSWRSAAARARCPRCRRLWEQKASAPLHFRTPR